MALFDTSPSTQFSKFNNFLTPVWKLHNPYCHSRHQLRHCRPLMYVQHSANRPSEKLRTCSAIQVLFDRPSGNIWGRSGNCPNLILATLFQLVRMVAFAECCTLASDSGGVDNGGLGESTSECRMYYLSHTGQNWL